MPRLSHSLLCCSLLTTLQENGEFTDEQMLRTPPVRKHAKKLVVACDLLFDPALCLPQTHGGAGSTAHISLESTGLELGLLSIGPSSFTTPPSGPRLLGAASGSSGGPSGSSAFGRSGGSSGEKVGGVGPLRSTYAAKPTHPVATLGVSDEDMPSPGPGKDRYERELMPVLKKIMRNHPNKNAAQEVWDYMVDFKNGDDGELAKLLEMGPAGLMAELKVLFPYMPEEYHLSQDGSKFKIQE